MGKDGLLSKVAIVGCGSGYPKEIPFDPNITYDEFSGSEWSKCTGTNHLYSQVREAFISLNLDPSRMQTADWNPLGDLVGHGQTVFIKPNFAKHEHKHGDLALLSTITHGSVLRPIIDYALKAVGPEGRVLIGDTPFEYSNWAQILKVTGVGQMVEALISRGFTNIELIDLRKYITEFQPGMRKTERKDQGGDPRGYFNVNLANDSAFQAFDHRPQNYHTLADHTVDHYDPLSTEIGITNEHHKPGLHEYLVSGSILDADLVINVPKLKTHGKTGVTLNLKNIIGIVSGKEYMPHHRPGSPGLGDAFPQAPNETFVKNRFARRSIAEKFGWVRKGIPLGLGSLVEAVGRKLILDRLFPTKQYLDDRIEWGDWSGNDTLWRTVIDLNKILLFADKNGILTDSKQRSFLSVIDGVCGQEGQGPTMGDPVDSRLLIAGLDPVATDLVACAAMGFDWNGIRLMRGALNQNKHRITNLTPHDIQLSVTSSPCFSKFKSPGNSPSAWADIQAQSHEDMFARFGEVTGDYRFSG